MSTELARTWTCDRCGRTRKVTENVAEMPKDWTELDLNAHVVGREMDEDVYHFCPQCHKQFRKWLAA